TRPPSPLPRPHDQVGVRDAWLPENPAPSVTRAARPGAGAGLAIVREAPAGASFHEAGGARGDDFAVQGPRSGAAPPHGAPGSLSDGRSAAAYASYTISTSSPAMRSRSAVTATPVAW